MLKNYKKGFTLIELLVVIAIIGILSSVVLASLNTARNKGADAAIKSNLANARAEAELYYDSSSTYGTDGAGGPSSANVCQTTGANTIGDNVEASLAAQGRSEDSYDSVAETCFVDGGGAGWAASVPLKTTPANFFCVDSTGQATTTTGIGISTTDVVCGG